MFAIDWAISLAQLISGRYAENRPIVEEDDSLVPCISDENFLFVSH